MLELFREGKVRFQRAQAREAGLNSLVHQIPIDHGARLRADQIAVIVQKGWKIWLLKGLELINVYPRFLLQELSLSWHRNSSASVSASSTNSL